MGEQAEIWKDLRNERSERRKRLGVNCPGCPKVQPKRIPTLLLPGQRCKVCGHVDRRKRDDSTTNGASNA